MKDKQNGFHCGEKEEMIKLSEETGDARDIERKRGKGEEIKMAKKRQIEGKDSRGKTRRRKGKRKQTNRLVKNKGDLKKREKIEREKKKKTSQQRG